MRTYRVKVNPLPPDIFTQFRSRIT